MIAITNLVWCAVLVNVGLVIAKIVMAFLSKPPAAPRAGEITVREIISETFAIWSLVLAATLWTQA
jgi:hypothetical protein